ncbi:MAG: hypothetical protein H6536_03810 [Bacteroidales bacterium]|nr:hypothetical protein [Bacteroidales bacterium]
MKKQALLIATLALTVLLTGTSYAQKYRKKETSVISFKLNIDYSYRSKFDSFGGLFNTPKYENANRVDNQIIYTAWDLISERIRNEAGMLLLPLDAYGKKFTYDNYGFPDIGIAKALKKGQSKYYIKIDVEIGPEQSARYATKSQPDTANKVVQLKEDEFKPKVTISLTIFSDKGIIPVASGTGEAAAEDILILNENFFDGIANGTTTADHTTLYKLIDKASQDLIISLFSK